jgi:hypothetical protein
MLDLKGLADTDGGVYRWGMAVATGMECDETTRVLSRLACGAKVSRSQRSRVDLNQSSITWMDRLQSSSNLRPHDAAMANLWAAALPSLLKVLSEAQWRTTLGTLLSLHDAVLQQAHPASPLHLMIGGELGFSLAYELQDLSELLDRRANSIQAMQAWLTADPDSISESLREGMDARLVLASLVRCKGLLTSALIDDVETKLWKEVGSRLATWVMAMTVEGGRSAFSPASREEVADDEAKGGLLEQAVWFDPDSLKPAMAAALGQSTKSHRLVWEISLPESLHHDANAKLAVMFPQWNVKRGRLHVDYSSMETKFELFAGKQPILAGRWETMIERDDQPQQPTAPWEEDCEFSDDEVHYLELEQTWSSGLLLQRQMMLLRDERCVLLADAVIPAPPRSDVNDHDPLEPVAAAAVTAAHQVEQPATSRIRYTCRLPLGQSCVGEADDETTEIVLSNGRKRAMVFPLAASEWRVGSTSCSLQVTEDQHLAMSMQGYDRLYAPLWFDLQPRRFKRNRTWRTLTVADQLRAVSKSEAAAYRIQIGSEQWMVYRSLSEPRSRTVLGNHLIADFFCSRFDAGDGSHEELITVEGNESSDD